jgi:ribosomal protein L44E
MGIITKGMGAVKLSQKALKEIKRLKKIEDKKLKQSEYQMRLRKYQEGYGGGTYPDPRKKFKKGMKKTKDGKLVPNYVDVKK